MKLSPGLNRVEDKMPYTFKCFEVDVLGGQLVPRNEFMLISPGLNPRLNKVIVHHFTIFILVLQLMQDELYSITYTA